MKHTERGEVTTTGEVGGGSTPGKEGPGSHGKACHLLHLMRPWSLKTEEGPLGLLARVTGSVGERKPGSFESSGEWGAGGWRPCA